MGDGMKIFKARNVFEEALERIRWVFDNFEEVICSHSGGKDSTIIFELALIVAREKGRLPLKVFFLDQEAEWKMTIDQIHRVMYHPDVDPMWMQVPFRMSNATSITDLYLNAWDPDEEEGLAIPPVTGERRFSDINGTHGIATLRAALGLFAVPGLKILDPSCGLGLTAKIALETGMTFYGNEINEARLGYTIRLLEKSVEVAYD